MKQLPILLVVRGQSAPAVGRVLEAAGVMFHPAQPSDAADSVSSGWAELVICDRAPGWQALVSRVETVGGAAVVLGPPPPAHELRGVPPEVEYVEELSVLIEAVARAEIRVEHRREPPDAEGLLERARTAELVNRFAQSIATQIDVPEVISEAVARTRDLCDADGASLLLVDPATGELFFDTVSGGASTRIERIRVQPGEGVAGRVAQYAEAMRVESVTGSPFFSERFDASSGFQTGSIIAVPLLMSGDVIGVLEAVRGTDRKGFRDGHLLRLQALAPHVTIAVHNAQMAARLRESQAAVLRSNQELEQKVRERTAQIGRAKREWEQTFDAISDPIAVQEGHTLVRANLAYARASGVPLTELKGKQCYQVFAGRNSPCPHCPLLRSKGDSAEVSGTDGATYESTLFRDPEAGAERVVISYRDVTERNLLASRVRESERLAAVGQLASGAAHEINNPLGFVISNLRGLRGVVESLSTAVVAPTAQQDLTDAAEMVGESLEGAERVGRIVRALRELSRQEIGRAEPCDVEASVSRVLRAELSGLENVAFLPGARGRAAIAPLQLDQVLSHVLKNARQAITPGQRIEIRTFDQGSELGIEVQDQGVGIAAEHLHRLFEPFFTTRGVGGGIGLGLTAAYGIVKRYGGRIEVESTQGSGTRFTIRLPLAYPPVERDPVPSSNDSWTSAKEA